MPLVGAVQVCPHEPQLLVVFKSVQVALQQSCPELQFETQVPLVGLHCKHWLLLQGAARQVEPHTLAVAQQLPFRQVWPEGQAQVRYRLVEVDIPLYMSRSRSFGHRDRRSHRPRSC